MKSFRKSFLEGLVVFLPFALTLYALYFLFSFAYGVLAFGKYVLPDSITDVPHFALLVDAGTILFSILFIILVGGLGRTFLGKAGIRLLERVVRSIPVLRSLYNGLRKIFDMLFEPKSSLFSRPVRVPFPHDGMTSLGLVTGEPGAELPEELRGRYCRVFVPTVPNPTSGFVILYEKPDIKVVDLRPEQVARLILSGGLLQEEASVRRQT